MNNMFDFNLNGTSVPQENKPTQVKENTPMASSKAPIYNFGEFPITVTLQENTYTVAPQDVASAEECGINESYDASVHYAMQARAAGYGYVLNVQEADAQPQG